MEHLLQNIRKAKNDRWNLGNSVLYRLCTEHPYHKTKDEIQAKIWLIGRAYAASIERRKNKGNINDDFYADVVVPIIKESEIDTWIKNSKTPESYLETHKKTVNLFKEISNLEKRSLASKYLHFHHPEGFFIYDSRVSGAINNLLKELGVNKTRNKIDEQRFDKSYALFFMKCLKAQEEIFRRYRIKLDNRQLDNLLIYLANEKLREKG